MYLGNKANHKKTIYIWITNLDILIGIIIDKVKKVNYLITKKKYKL